MGGEGGGEAGGSEGGGDEGGGGEGGGGIGGGGAAHRLEQCTRPIAHAQQHRPCVDLIEDRVDGRIGGSHTRSSMIRASTPSESPSSYVIRSSPHSTSHASCVSYLKDVRSRAVGRAAGRLDSSRLLSHWPSGLLSSGLLSATLALVEREAEGHIREEDVVVRPEKPRGATARLRRGLHERREDGDLTTILQQARCGREGRLGGVRCGGHLVPLTGQVPRREQLARQPHAVPVHRRKLPLILER